MVYCLFAKFYGKLPGSQLLSSSRRTPRRFCSIMIYFLLALLLLSITYDKCNISLTPPLEFVRLFNAENAFMSTQHHSHIASSLTYSPVRHFPETIALNQCHHSLIGHTAQHSHIGRMAQHSHIGCTTRHNFIGCTTQHSLIGCMTQHSLIAHTAQPSHIGHTTQHSHFGRMAPHHLIGHMTQRSFIEGSFVGPTTQHSFVGPTIQHSFIDRSFVGPMTQHSFIGPTIQQSFIGLTTQHSFIGPMTQLSFIDRMTQHHCNKSGLMTQILGNAETFLYRSEYSFVTQQHVLVGSSSYFEYQHNQFPEKRDIPILHHSQIKISSVDTLHFLHYISARFLHRLKMRLTFCHAWNINCNIYIFMSSSHDVNFLIACILMKLQRYITRRHDFACYWRLLLIHGLLKSQHMFFWVLIALFSPLCIFFINLIIFLTNQVMFLMNLFIFLCILFIKLLKYLYMKIRNMFICLRRLCIMILRNKIKIVLHLCLLLIHFYEWAYFMTFYIPETFVFTASDAKFKHTFVGGGASTQSNFKMLEPYIISTDFQV